MQYVSILPRNTIVAQLAYSEQPPFFCFPFFPSHLSLPCKAGETVWCIVEDPETPFINLAYWMCKITEPHNADDVNHTHSPRSYDISMSGIDRASKRERSQNDGLTDPVYELRLGDVQIKYDERRDNVNRPLLPNVISSTYFEEIVLNTDAGKLTQYEAVPRFKKRPGDIAFEGTNNTLIVLGTDRKNSIATFSTNKDQGPRPSFPETDLTGSAGSIDLVVGRGQIAQTFGVEVSTTSVYNAKKGEKGFEIKKELGKSEDQLSPNEGDFDYVNDRSRILISQRTNVDSNFGLTEFNKEFGISDKIDPNDNINSGDAAIVLKTDKIRLIARSDVEILVTGFTPMKNAQGKDIKEESDDTSDFAAIIIKSDGSIIFKPSDEGYIKLGSDMADKALLCSPALPENGNVTAQPISNTLGPGYVGTGAPGQGTWARKVLVD